MLARISSADLVQTKGVGSWLWTAMYSRIADYKSFTLRNTPRRIRLLVSSANHRSTKLIHEPYVGVKWTWNRGRLTNHFRIIAVL